jgi:hypothetical protein
MSLIGVVFASMSSGLGELCYLALSSHYKKYSFSFYSFNLIHFFCADRALLHGRRGREALV